MLQNDMRTAAKAQPTIPAHRFLRIAARLMQMETGSPGADRAIHKVLARSLSAPPYTRNETVARMLLPVGFEWTRPTHVDGRIYAACARIGVGSDGLPMPHHGAWGSTEALAVCGAAMRALAALGKG